MDIFGGTQIVGIIGDPVSHSLSPAMQNAAFAACKLNFVYVPFHVRPAQLRTALGGIRALGIAGANVTVPHKERVIPFLDSVSATARRAGAVNTIVNSDGHLYGENTDVIGFLRALKEVRFRVSGVHAVVVGAGGVARAVLTALADGGATAVVVANRTAQRAQRLAATVDSPRMRVAAVRLDALQDPKLLGGVQLVVNATAMGLHREAFFPLRYGATSPRCLFYDLIYGSRTDFLMRASRAGRQTLGGASMLLHQGAAAFRLWTARRPPLSVMRAALPPG